MFKIKGITTVNFATLDLNLLRVLDAIMKESSTTKAGERLGISQSAVSNALNRLRHSLGDELFVRQGNQLVPTDYAASLQEGLRDELERLETLLTRAEFDPSAVRGAYRIAAADYFSEMLMPELNAVINREAPKLLLQQVNWDPNEHLRSLEQGNADLGLGPLLIAVEDLPPWINSTHLFDSGFVGIGARDNPYLADIPNNAPLPIDRYFDVSHVLFSSSGALESFEDDVLKSLGRHRRIALTIPNFYGVFRAVSTSDHIAAVPISLALRLAPRYELKIFALPFDIGKIPIHATWHKRSDSTPLARWMRSTIFDLLEPLGSDNLD